MVTIPKGQGYWLIDDYPIGGCFRRATEDLHGAITRTFKLYHGVDCEVLLDNGHKVAVRQSDIGREATC